MVILRTVINGICQYMVYSNINNGQYMYIYIYGQYIYIWYNGSYISIMVSGQYMVIMIMVKTGIC